MLIALIGLSALGIAVRIALPSAIAWAIPWAAQSQAGALASVGNVDLGIFAGEITLENLRVELPADTSESQATPASPAEPLLELARLHVAFEWSELFANRIHINTLSLEAPRIRLTQLRNGDLQLPVPPAPEGSESGEEANSVSAEQPSDAVDDETDPGASDDEAGWEFVLDVFEIRGVDATLTSEATRTESMRFGAARLALNSLEAVAGTVTLGDIEFEQPTFNFERDWLMSLGSGDSEPSDSTPENTAASTETPPVELKNLKIDRLEFTVNTRNGPARVEIRLRIVDARSTAGHVFPIEVGAKLDDGRIDLAGNLGLNPASFQGRLSWQGLRMPPFLLLSMPNVVPWLTSARADGDLEVSFHSTSGSQPAGLITSGTSSISDLVFTDPDNGELAVECERLEMVLRRGFYPLEPSAESPIRLDVESLSLERPQILYTNPPDALDRLFVAIVGADPQEGQEGPQDDVAQSEPVTNDPATAGASSPSESSAPRISVGTLTINEGHLRYSDRTVTPTHETNIDRLKAKIDGITGAPGAQSIAVDGIIQKTGTFKLRGKLPDGSGDLTFDLHRIDLVSYDSFAREAGWRIHSGETTLNSKIGIDGGIYDTYNELVLHNLRVKPDEASDFSSTFGMSLDLALALLRDPSGDIALTLPVRVGDETSLGLGSLIWSAVRDAIVGALTSPIKLMGSLLPGGDGPMSFEAIGFEPGSEVPNDAAEQRLASLTELLSSRPTLRVSLQGRWSDADRPVLARAILHENALSGAALPEIEDGGIFARRRVLAALRERAVGNEGSLEPEDEQWVERYVEAQEVSTERFRALADARSAHARAVLLESGVPANSIVLAPATSSDEAGVSLKLEPKPGDSQDEQEVEIEGDSE